VVELLTFWMVGTGGGGVLLPPPPLQAFKRSPKNPVRMSATAVVHFFRAIR
jgi:hypothetical protein